MKDADEWNCRFRKASRGLTLKTIARNPREISDTGAQVRVSVTARQLENLFFKLTTRLTWSHGRNSWTGKLGNRARVCFGDCLEGDDDFCRLTKLKKAIGCKKRNPEAGRGRSLGKSALSVLQLQACNCKHAIAQGLIANETCTASTSGP